MGPFKAPRLNEYDAYFYQTHQSIVGDDVCHAVLSFLNDGADIAGINYTYIVLIPKDRNPKTITEYGPISFCNVINKVITKVLANILKLVLPSIIFPNQCAFVPKSLITDNIIAAYETLHTMHTNLHGKHGQMTLKLDMNKAYD